MCDEVERVLAVTRPQLSGQAPARDRSHRGLPGRYHIARRQGASVHSAAGGHHVGRHRPEPSIAQDAARDREVRPRAAAPACESQLIAGAQRYRDPRRGRCAVDAQVEVGAGDRDQARRLDQKTRSGQRALERCGAAIVAHDQVGGRVGEAVHGAAGRHS